MGDSGNAEGIGVPLPLRDPRCPTPSWYQAAAINAAYSLDAAEPAREGPQVPPETFWPWNNANDLVRRQYTDLLGRNASLVRPRPTGATSSTPARVTPQAMMEVILTSAESDQKNHAVARLYEAYFLRRPDIERLQLLAGPAAAPARR